MNYKESSLSEIEVDERGSDITSEPILVQLESKEKRTISVNLPTLFSVKSGSFLLSAVEKDFYLVPESIVLLRTEQVIDISCITAGELDITTIPLLDSSLPFSSDLQFDLELLNSVYEINRSPFLISNVGYLNLYFGGLDDIFQGADLLSMYGSKCIFSAVQELPFRSKKCDVLVVGAGPIGLGIGASLANQNSDTIILGEPLSFWWHSILPQPLRSPLTASSVYISGDDYDLTDFCRNENINVDGFLPFPVFMAYTMKLLNRYQNLVRAEKVKQIVPAQEGWMVEVETPNGPAIYMSKSVVIATGLLPMANLPFGNKKSVQHTSKANRFDCERPDIGSVAIIGGGQSALEFALYAAHFGKSVSVLIRDSELMFRNLHEPGHYWYKRLAKHSEKITNWLPNYLKSKLLSFLLKGTVEPRLKKEILDSGIQIHGNFRIAKVEASESGISISAADGRQLIVDSVISGTGYHWNIDRLDFLKNVTRFVKCQEGMPYLTSECESSLPGLFFAGYGAMRRVGFKAQFVQGSRLVTAVVVPAILRRLREK